MSLFDKIATAFQHGGFWMYPILMLQISTLAIMAERFYSLYLKRKTNQMDFALSFEDNIRRGEMDLVIKKAQSNLSNYTLAPAILAGAEAAQSLGGREEIQGKMDEHLLHENSLIDRRIGFLSLLANVSTLTGLLGTITGMIKSFAAVAFSSPSEKAALLAAGISEAMNATAYGLIVAIPALLAYAIYQNRANTLSENLNQAALKVFNWLSYSYNTVAYRSSGKSSEVKTNKEITL